MSEVLDAALAQLARRGCAPATVAAVRSAARALARWTGRGLADTTREEVEALVASYAAKAPATQAALVVRLRLLCGALVELGLIAADPSARLASVAASSPPQRVLALDEVRRQLVVASDPARYRKLGVALALRDRACLELLYGLGIRRSEAGRARVQDLRLGDGSLVVARSKRGGVEELPLPLAAVDPLRRYLVEGRPALAAGPRRSGGDRLLLSHRGGALGDAGVWRVVRRVAAAASVEARPHDYRRSVATHLVASGVSVEAVRRLLGHADLGTTARYVRLGRDQLRAAVAALEQSDARPEGPTSSHPTPP